jgi:heme-degrading monooxygenase HmoA
VTELVTTGVWRVQPGQEAVFTHEWTEFARWAASMPGATTLRLCRDTGDLLRFVSFAPWRDTESAHAWKGLPEFRERIARVLQYVDGFEPAELGVVTVVEAGAYAPAEGR